MRSAYIERVSADANLRPLFPISRKIIALFAWHSQNVTMQEGHAELGCNSYQIFSI
jgi:hypothetical protein